MKSFQASLPLPKKNNQTAGLFALFLLGFTSPATAWTVLVRGTDVTQFAAPIARTGAPDVNVTALAASLGLQVRVIDGEATLFDADGNEWRGRNGALSLETIGRSVRLRSPLLLQGTTLFLPLDLVAQLAGLRLNLDLKTERAVLEPAQANTIPGSSAGLETFTLEKTSAEIASDAKNQDATSGPPKQALVSHLPATSDSLRLRYGIGYVQGYDAGMELSGYGKAWGFGVGLNTLLTYGTHGIGIKNGYLSLQDPAAGRKLEIGQLSNDLQGLSVGARISWRAAANRNSSVSLLLDSPQGAGHTAALVYHDEVQFSPMLRLGGDIATNGGVFLKGNLQTRRYGVFGYCRTGADKTLNSAGAFFSYRLGKGVGLYGGFSRAGGGDHANDWRSVSVSFPLRRGIDLTVEHTQNGGAGSRNAVDALTLSLPAGPFRLLTRYQFGNTQLQAGLLNSSTLRSHNRDLVFSAAFLNSRRLNLNYQASVSWQQDARPSMTGQMTSALQISDRARFEMVGAFPQLFDMTQQRARLSYDLRSDLSLSLDYGLLSPYQPRVSARAADRGLMLLLRSHLDVFTPSPGVDVSGQTLDQSGRPMGQALVRLNAYQTLTDKNGRYTFHHVPAGEYTVRLDQESLPADYKVTQGEKRIVICAHRQDSVDFQVALLRSITGHAYCKGEGIGENGAGVAGVAVFLGGFATATGSDGSFTFYNVEPGRHVIRLDTDRLSKEFDLVSPAEITTDLSANASISDLVFHLARHEKPIQFQSLP